MKKQASEGKWNAIQHNMQAWWDTIGHVITFLPNKFIALVSGPTEKSTSGQRTKPALAKASPRKKAR